jgi:hypothetical protein
MLYSVKDGSLTTWYATLENRNGWKLGAVKGSEREAVAVLLGVDCAGKRADATDSFEETGHT